MSERCPKPIPAWMGNLNRIAELQGQVSELEERLEIVIKALARVAWAMGNVSFFFEASEDLEEILKGLKDE